MKLARIPHTYSSKWKMSSTTLVLRFISTICPPITTCAQSGGGGGSRRSRSGGPPPVVVSQRDLTGPTSIEAVNEQLGLRLEPQIGAIQFLVIDYVEEPSAN